jgi:hypothetical protein
MKNAIVIIFCHVFLNLSFADEKLKTFNNDLRHDDVLLSIEDAAGNWQNIFKGSGEQYYLGIKKKDSIEKHKISNAAAEKYDILFVEKFIHLKYSLPPFSGKNCSKSFTLSMRGETYEICKDEKEKLKVLDELQDQFKVIIQ